MILCVEISCQIGFEPVLSHTEASSRPCKLSRYVLIGLNNKSYLNLAGSPYYSECGVWCDIYSYCSYNIIVSRVAYQL